ncbi:sodium-dependent transporter [Methylococcus capsulatus]|jgi:NSS family neurotransmitter:Na+ symporter|uniref:Transporter n=1 Tax=Methylococcus capsulatus TaxID=414 RepID=A0AA35UE15_METCP|nr:sodium-dependent transporter [Methylococcus capsulatus]QXP91827.1 sodium-dependent transporter [Methylococcus capsulatus]CAI8821941.1 Transporter [Methylococcus capsulatus]
MTDQRFVHVQWSSRLAFVLAASGSAIGLGNIWKFPYLTGEHGGGAFVLVYLLCVAAIGIPIMIAETLLGRRGRQSPINAMRSLAETAKVSPAWQYAGWLGVISGFLILSYYSVIAGWALAYVFKMNSALFSHVTPETAARYFDEFRTDPQIQVIWHTLFMVATVAIVSRGVNGGLEKGTRYLMPALAVMLVVLVLYAVGTEGLGRAVAFLFLPDFSRLSGESVLTAMGQAFFSLGLGMGSIMVYGSYLPSHVSIARSTIVVAAADTAVALFAGLAIFPIVFSNHLEPGMGPGLIFQTLPIAFGAMPGGSFFGALFFVLVFFAALTSSIAMIEPAVAWLTENRGLSREAASAWSGLACWGLGLGTLLSFSSWSDVRLFGRNLFELLDFLTADVMLPIGGFLVAVFAGWVLSRRDTEEELEMADSRAYEAWRFLVRYVAPSGMGIIFLKAMELI